MLPIDPSKPNAFNNQITIATTITMFRIVLIFRSIGIQVWINQRRTPATIKTITMVSNGISFFLLYKDAAVFAHYCYINNRIRYNIHRLNKPVGFSASVQWPMQAVIPMYSRSISNTQLLFTKSGRLILMISISRKNNHYR